MKTLDNLNEITSLIHIFRGQKVMLDKDLAVLYGIGTRDLNKAVTRNLDRFPEDFMFQLSQEELKNLMFHFGTSSWGGTRKSPRVFTEHGILMLSSVLKSKRAIQVNITIMRVFLRLRQLLLSHKDLALRLEKIEQNTKEHGGQIQTIFEVLKQILAVEEKPKRRIGFHAD